MLSNKDTDRITYKVTNMRCTSCALIIQMNLEDAGYKCRCSYATGLLEVNGSHDKNAVIEIVKKAGYNLKTI
jgi:ABC-type ATPase with predicted acetyltransferase domain